MEKEHLEKHLASLQGPLRNSTARKQNVISEWTDVFRIGLNVLPSGLPAYFSCEGMFGMSTPFHHLRGSPHGIATHGIYNLSLTSVPLTL